MTDASTYDDGFLQGLYCAAQLAEGEATCGCKNRYGRCNTDDPANAIAAKIRARAETIKADTEDRARKRRHGAQP